MFKAASLFLVLMSAAWWLFLGPGREIPACSRPISYEIGVFDGRFGLSGQELVVAMKEAESVWEGPSGRDLFAYAPEDAELPVNLIYDYRQEVTEELGGIEEEIESTEADYRLLESRYQRLASEYEALEAAYERRIAELERKKKVTQTEFESAQQLENELNAKVADLNSTIDRLNRLARELNLNVDQYNTVGASRGETYEGGVFYSDESGKRINIYEFSSREKLVRILAHEFGHALGLEHISDPSAIMYFLNQSSAGATTASDLQALNVLCGGSK